MSSNAPDLEGDAVDAVLPLCDLYHLALDVFLRGPFHVDVVTITAGVVAGDGLEDTHTHTHYLSCLTSWANS